MITLVSAAIFNMPATLRSKPQTNKQSGLPVGVTMTWRTREDRQPYLEFLVNWKDRHGKARIKHFYVGVAPTLKEERDVRRAAIQFRKSYESRKG